MEPLSLKPGNVAVKITNRNSFLSLRDYECNWSVMTDGVVVQSGKLAPVVCAPGESVVVKIPVVTIERPQAGAEFWLRVDFHNRTGSHTENFQK
jgi:hypothetical protein